MPFMPMEKLGPAHAGTKVSFGILLPGIHPSDGFRLKLRMIHDRDQFLQDEMPYNQFMEHSVDPTYGDYWSTTVDLTAPGSGKRWGAPGRYVYRYALHRGDDDMLDWIIDPFAREFGVGRHAAWTYGYEPYVWSDGEAQWRTPRHHDLVMYELNIMEFAGSLSAAADRLDYLQDLGITCLSLMPVTNVVETLDWGYTPIGYFGVDERFGKRSDFQGFVDQAHQRGLAVLVDAIYGHTSPLFAYEYLYSWAGVPNPMMGSFAADMYGYSVDWTRAFAQDLFFTVNRKWLEDFHVDGFRYDCVPNYWELWPHYRGFAHVVHHTYQHVKQQVAQQAPDYLRFDDGDAPLRLIQCAEQLEHPREALQSAYATATWQTQTLHAAGRVARGEDGAICDFGARLGADGYPTEREHAGDHLHKSPLQYLETHDESRFICRFGVHTPEYRDSSLFAEGDRGNWYRLQPYLIGLLLAKGIPLLWQGQELCESAQMAAEGPARIAFLRPVHWERFYDHPGRGTIGLVRRLLKVRAARAHVRDGAFYYFDDYEHYVRQGLLVFARFYPDTDSYTLVALNFTAEPKWAPFWFPVDGRYREELHGELDPGLDLHGVEALVPRDLWIPSNYGRVWTHA